MAKDSLNNTYNNTDLANQLNAAANSGQTNYGQNYNGQADSQYARGVQSWSEIQAALNNANASQKSPEQQMNESNTRVGTPYQNQTKTEYARGTQSASTNGSLTTPDLTPVLNQWRDAAEQQQLNQIEYSTQKGIDKLQRAEEDAQANFRTAQEQIDADEAQARDNQVLYAEARGDKGGIGAAQYDNVANTAAINRQAVRDQQTKLSTDTWRQIADLRAQGEYQKADALLQVAQTYLSNLMSLEQWAANYGLSVAQFQESIRQWENNYKAQIAEMMGSYDGVETLAARNANRDFDLRAAEAEEQKRQWENEYAAKMAQIMGTYNGQETLEARNQRANLEMEAAKLKEAIREWEANNEINVANLTGMYQGNKTIDAQKAEQELALKLAEVTGYLNGTPTLNREKLAADIASVKGQQTSMEDILSLLQGMSATGANQTNVNSRTTSGSSGGSANSNADTIAIASQLYNSARDAYLRGEITAEEAAATMQRMNVAANEARGLGSVVTAAEDIANVLNGTLKAGSGSTASTTTTTSGKTTTTSGKTTTPTQSLTKRGTSTTTPTVTTAIGSPSQTATVSTLPLSASAKNTITNYLKKK